MSEFEEILKIKIPRYKKSPLLFCNEVLKFEPDKWQEKALLDLATYNKVSIRSGQGVGKTGLEACALLWFLCCFPYARVVATAPTRQQLHDVLWSEVAKWQAKSPLLKQILKWTKTRVTMLSQEERWFAVARTATKPENMQGFHEDNMLFIVDEASGVADPIMEAILGTLSGKNNKLLMCGNPTRKTGVFYESHTSDKEIYKTHKISSLDSNRTNKENIESLLRKYGKNSNVARVRVFGEFPIDEDDVFIQTSLVESAIQAEQDLEIITTIDIGVDVARFGDDSTVITSKVNNVVLSLNVRNGIDLVKTAEETIHLALELRKKYNFDKKIYVKIDDTGVGGGVTDTCRSIKNKNENLDWLIIVPVNFNLSVNHAYYYDFNTVLWGNLKDLLEENRIVLPNDVDLIGELTNRKKGFSNNGKIKLESKKEMKKRGLPSPDRADSVALAVFPITDDAGKKRRKGGNRR